MTVSAICPATCGTESPEHCFILVTKSSDGHAPYRVCSRCGIREMLPGDIITAEYLAEMLVKRLPRLLGLSYEQFSASLPDAKRFHSGGIIRAREPKLLPEGAVGWTFDGRPIYDGDWFDRKMASLPGTSVTIHVGHDVVTGVKPGRSE